MSDLRGCRELTVTFIGKAVPFYKEDPNGLLYLLLSMCVAWVCSVTREVTLGTVKFSRTEAHTSFPQE